MRDVLIKNWIINLSVWAIIYIFKTVTIWEFTNPFQWIIDIPTYQPHDRGVGFFFIVLWQLTQIVTLYLNKKQVI